MYSSKVCIAATAADFCGSSSIHFLKKFTASKDTESRNKNYGNKVNTQETHTHVPSFSILIFHLDMPDFVYVSFLCPLTRWPGYLDPPRNTDYQVKLS